MKLDKACGICGSTNWCGRQCVNAPKEVQKRTEQIPVERKPKTVRMKEAKAAFDKVAYQREYMRNIYRPKVKLRKNAPITS